MDVLPKAYKEIERERDLSDAEIAAVWRTLHDSRIAKKDFSSIREIFLLMLFTGQRIGSVCRMRWDALDLERAEWRFFATDAKNSRPFIVPLVASALSLLSARASATSSEFVFPGRTKGAAKPIYTGSIERWVRRHEHRFRIADVPIPAWNPHDIRRTVRTGLSVLRIGSDTAELCIGHVPPKLTRTYDRYTQLQEKRDALIAWEKHVLAIVGTKSQ